MRSISWNDSDLSNPSLSELGSLKKNIKVLAWKYNEHDFKMMRLIKSEGKFKH